jgi:hypothetical protein
MRRLLLWSAVAGFTACLIRPTLVAITPEYGYVDGCAEVVISGHDLGTSATAKLVGEAGEVDLELVPPATDKKIPDHAQDVGFEYTAVIPPAPNLQPGWFDVVVSVDGDTLTLNDGWYYRTCPATFRVDGFEIPYLQPGDATVDAGAAITVQGCGFTDDVALQFLQGDDGYGAVAGTAQPVSDCATAAVHYVIPQLPPNETFSLQLVHPDGTVSPLFQSCLNPDSADTGGCTEVAVVVVGGAR